LHTDDVLVRVLLLCFVLHECFCESHCRSDPSTVWTRVLKLNRVHTPEQFRPGFSDWLQFMKNLFIREIRPVLPLGEIVDQVISMSPLNLDYFSPIYQTESQFPDVCKRHRTFFPRPIQFTSTSQTCKRRPSEAVELHSRSVKSNRDVNSFHNIDAS
jgi:hypothetical protein